MTWRASWHGEGTLLDWLAEGARAGLPPMMAIDGEMNPGDILDYGDAVFRVVRLAIDDEVAIASTIPTSDIVTDWPMWIVEPIATEDQVDAVARQLLATVQPTTLDYKAALALFAAKAKGEMTGAAVIEACRPLKQPGVMEEAFEHIEVLFAAMHKDANGQKLTQTEIIQAFGDLLTLREASQAVWS